jgi:hypothetical protein
LLPLGQVSLWDIIVERKENATIWRRTRNKYSFVDQVSILNSVLLLDCSMFIGLYASLLSQELERINSKEVVLSTSHCASMGFCDFSWVKYSTSWSWEFGKWDFLVSTDQHFQRKIRFKHYVDHILISDFELHWTQHILCFRAWGEKLVCWNVFVEFVDYFLDPTVCSLRSSMSKCVVVSCDAGE